jgi:hypothetical protein
MSAFPTADVYTQALALNGSAFAGSHYEVAYHLLMSALHCAEDLGDMDRLAEVSALAGAQQRSLDQAAPGHRLATASARGARGVFAVAATTAEGVRQRLHSQQWIAAHHRPRT